MLLTAMPVTTKRSQMIAQIPSDLDSSVFSLGLPKSLFPASPWRYGTDPTPSGPASAVRPLVAMATGQRMEGRSSSLKAGSVAGTRKRV